MFQGIAINAPRGISKVLIIINAILHVSVRVGMPWPVTPLLKIAHIRPGPAHHGYE